MSDDWEDWEEESFAPPALKQANAANEKTKGDLLLDKAKEVDVSKFAGEDEGEDEEPAWKSTIPNSQPVQNFLRSSRFLFPFNASRRGEIAYRGTQLGSGMIIAR